MTESQARPPRLKHPANGARIAATGISTTAMLAILVALGSGSTEADSEELETKVEPLTNTAVLSAATSLQSPAVVVPASPAQSVAIPASTSPADLPQPATATSISPPPSNQPVQLTPTQIVTVISAPAPSPTTKTKGS